MLGLIFNSLFISLFLYSCYSLFLSYRETKALKSAIPKDLPKLKTENLRLGSEVDKFFFKYWPQKKCLEVGCKGRYGSLHFLNVNPEVLEDLKRILKKLIQSPSLSGYEVFNEYSILVAGNNIKVLEIEQYVEEHKPIFNTHLKWFRDFNNKESWSIYNEDAEQRLRAQRRLPFRPSFCDLGALLEYHQKKVPDFPKELDLSWSDQGLFLSLIMEMEVPVFRTALHDPREDQYEKLRSVGLIHQAQPSFSDKLQLLSLYELQMIRFAGSVSNQEELALDRLEIISQIQNQPDLTKDAERFLSAFTFYRLRTPTELGFDVANIVIWTKYWRFLRESFSLVIGHLSQLAFLANEEQLEEGKEYRLVNNSDFSCKLKLSFIEKKLKKDNAPVLPMHIGCNCHLEPID